jgi:hypothetical protein
VAYVVNDFKGLAFRQSFSLGEYATKVALPAKLQNEINVVFSQEAIKYANDEGTRRRAHPVR